MVIIRSKSVTPVSVSKRKTRCKTNMKENPQKKANKATNRSQPTVPYAAAMLSLLGVFAQPYLRSIASKQVGPSEQGKAQGCISGLCSFASILSPLVFSPITALFLSTDAPFKFPGFSIACAGFVVMIAFVQSIMIKTAPTVASSKTSACVCV